MTERARMTETTRGDWERHTMMTLERARAPKVTWVSLVGLILVPLLVAAGFLWATWNSDRGWTGSRPRSSTTTRAPRSTTSSSRSGASWPAVW